MREAAEGGGWAPIDELLLEGRDLLIVADEASRCTYASPAVVELTGYRAADLFDLPVGRLIHPADQHRFEVEATRQADGEHPDSVITCRLMTADGRPVPVEARVRRLPPGHPVGAVAITAVDVGERNDLLRARREGMNILQQIAEGRPDTEVFALVAAFVERRAPGSMVAISRLDESGTHLRLVAAGSLPATVLEHVDGVPVGPASGSCAVAARLRSPVIVNDIARDPRWDDLRDPALDSGLHACWSAPVIAQGAGPLHGTIALYWSETRAPSTEHFALLDQAVALAALVFERSRMEHQLVQQLTHDPLTGLANRSLLRDRIDQALARLRRGQLGDVALVLIDLVHFHEVTDSHGYATGDEVIREVGRRLTRTVREVDSVARFSGTGFAVLAHTGDAATLVVRLGAALDEPIAIGGDDVSVGALGIHHRIGIAVATREDSTDGLLRTAEHELAGNSGPTSASIAG